MRLINFINNNEDFDPANIDKEYTFFKVQYDNNSIILIKEILKYDNKANVFIKSINRSSDGKFLYNVNYESNYDYEWLFYNKEDADKEIQRLKVLYESVLSIMNEDKEKFLDNTESIISPIINDNCLVSDIDLLKMQINIYFKAIRNKDLTLTVKELNDKDDNGV